MCVKKERCWYVELTWLNTVIAPNNVHFREGNTTFNSRYSKYGEVSRDEDYEGVEYDEVSGVYNGEPNAISLCVLVKSKTNVAEAKRMLFAEYQKWYDAKVAEVNVGLASTKKDNDVLWDEIK